MQILEHASQLGSATFTEKAMQFILEPLPPYQAPSESLVQSDPSDASDGRSQDMLQSIHELRKRSGDAPVCADVMRLKHVVTYSLSLARLWLKYTRTQGLLAWAEVTHAHALEFVNTCYTITQDTPSQGSDDQWYRVPKNWLSAWEAACILDPVIGINPACALQGIAARWLSAHYKTIARSMARAMARGLGFVTPCPNKQGKNAYFSKVPDASSTACDAVNVRKDCQHFGPPLWVVPVEERGPFGGPS